MNYYEIINYLFIKVYYLNYAILIFKWYCFITSWQSI